MPKPTTADPDELTLRQLRAELKRIGLSPSGLKSALIKRLRIALGKERDDEETPLPPLSSKPNSSSKEEVENKKAPSTPLTTNSPSITEKAERNGISKRKPIGQTKVLIPNQAVNPPTSQPEREDPADLASDLYQSMSESDQEGAQNEEQRQESAKKRKVTSIGLTDAEIKRRKSQRIQNSSERFQNYSFVDNHNYNQPQSFMEMQSDFLHHASLEYERIKVQRRHALEITALQDEITQLKRELDAKDKLIDTLKNVVLEKTELLETFGNVAIPRELVQNWAALERLLTINTVH